MSGQVCRRIEESAWEAGPPSIPELDTASPVPASATRRRRSSAETMPTSSPLGALEASHPEWCVDMGDALLSMTTFELWEAIERRAVAPWVRVWREGLECWTPVGEVPELGWAVASAPEPTPVVTTILEAAPEPTPGPIAATTPAPPPQSGATRTPAHTARAVSRQASRASLSEATPLTQPSPAVARTPRGGARWVLAGSAVAALALGVAIFRAADPPAPAPAASPVAALGAVTHVAPPVSPVASPALPVEASPSLEPALAEPPAPAAAPAVRRNERGQRRLPRGGHGAYGR